MFLANIIYIVVNAIQMIGIFVPLAGCVLLLRKAYSRTAMYLLLANLGCLIINGGYMLLLSSKTYEGAHAALKMEYFGNVIFYLMFCLFLWTYLRMKRSRLAAAFLVFWSVMDIIFYFLIWTGDSLHLAFQSLDFEWNERLRLTMIQLEPGFFFMMHCCIISMVVVCGMVYTMVRMFLVEIPTERRNLAKLAGAQFVIAYSLTLTLLLKLPFDIVPICASSAILFIIISIHHNGLLGVTEIGREWVFDQMEDAFVIVDEMYGYLDSNAYAKKVFAELNSKRKNVIVSGELLRLFLNEEKIQQINGKYYHKKVIEMNEKGRVSGYSLLLVDITEQYELMERVKEEKERADAANQAKSAFVSDVSHEIRTPMNAIVGMTQIMLRRELPQQDKEYLKNIQNSGNALLTIVNDLLDLSKIESGKMELVDEAYDFMGMLSDLGMIILNRIGKKPVELLFDIDPDIPARLYGDALRIRQIIINLMNNATKFTEEGYVCLTVKAGQIQQDDIELFLSIKDTGQGIREEDLGRLFGSFQQVDTKKNHHKEGTGLGLSISKRLVELMQGTIGVTSEYGKGSEFYFSIHQRIVDAAKAAQISPERHAVVIGGLKNRTAGELLKRLAEQYQLTYTAELASLKQTQLPVFYFTDQYGQLGEGQKQKLDDLQAVVCVLKNPMAEGASEEEFPEGVLAMNKPLYSYNFCNVIENRQIPGEGFGSGTAEPERDVPREEGTVDTAVSTAAFTVPDACILIVDDNEVNCMVAEEMLKPLQMQIETASDGRRALEMIQKKQYDLIFMDHLMPVMDGIEAVQALRRMEGAYYKNVPVIALTANTAKEQQQEYRRAGMSDFLAKPIDMQDIYRIIRKWLAGKAKLM